MIKRTSSLTMGLQLSPFVLLPVVYDTFTDANGTSLDAHTPNVDKAGNGWVEDVGNWSINSNKADPVTAVGATNEATVNAEIADVTCQVIVNTGPNNANTHGFSLRYTDADNYWIIGIRPGDNTIKIFERDTAVTTQRASTSVTIDINTDYIVKVTANDEAINATVNGGSDAAYGSAAFNKTVTSHGLKAGNTVVTFDNFTVWPFA